MVSPRGNIYIVTRGASAAIYRAPAAPSTSRVNTLVRVAGAPSWVTDGTFLDDSTVVLRTFTSLYVLNAFSWATTAAAELPDQPDGQALTTALGSSTTLVALGGRSADDVAVPTTLASVAPAPSLAPGGSVSASAGTSASASTSTAARRRRRHLDGRRLVEQGHPDGSGHRLGRRAARRGRRGRQALRRRAGDSDRARSTRRTSGSAVRLAGWLHEPRASRRAAPPRWWAPARCRPTRRPVRTVRELARRGGHASRQGLLREPTAMALSTVTAGPDGRWRPRSRMMHLREYTAAGLVSSRARSPTRAPS